MCVHVSASNIAFMMVLVSRQIISACESDNIFVDYGTPGLKLADAEVRGLYSPYQVCCAVLV